MTKNNVKIIKKVLVISVMTLLLIGSIQVLAAEIKLPKATGVTVLNNQKAAVDVSNLKDGYVMVKYTGTSKSTVKLIIQKDKGTSYTYTLKSGGNYEAFPLTEGDGTYKITVFENVGGNKYATAYGTSVSLKLTDVLSPFLFPNQYIDFTSASKVVAEAKIVTKSCKTELDKVKAVYGYVLKNIAYDYEKAKTVKTGYLPVVDNVLKEKKGICFDYAAVMVSMLRSQGIPSKLIIGYVDSVYHAWISVYTKDKGWIENAIYFDGEVWQLVDPTFASTSQNPAFKPEPKKYAAQFAY